MRLIIKRRDYYDEKLRNTRKLCNRNAERKLCNPNNLYARCDCCGVDFKPSHFPSSNDDTICDSCKVKKELTRERKMSNFVKNALLLKNEVESRGLNISNEEIIQDVKLLSSSQILEKYIPEEEWSDYCFFEL